MEGKWKYIDHRDINDEGAILHVFSIAQVPNFYDASLLAADNRTFNYYSLPLLLHCSILFCTRKL